MANYDELKKKAKDALGTIADVSAEAYRVAEEKARILAKRARLNAEITREKALIRRMKNEIGNKYYALHKDDAEEALKDECASITDALVRIAEKRCAIEELKTGGGSSSSECTDACCEECGSAESSDGSASESSADNSDE